MSDVTRHCTSPPAAGPGFTLLESLVSVSVIAMLIALLGPMMADLHKRVRVLDCQGQLREQNLGLLNLAMAENGRLPFGPVENGGWVGDIDRGSPSELYDAARPERGLRSRDGWYGLGVLWRAGMIDDAHVFFCPARTAVGRGYRHAWPRAFEGHQPADGKTRIHTSYAYRGGMESQAGTPLGPVSLGRDPAVTPIHADDPTLGAQWHPEGYNVGHLDGSIRLYTFDTPPVPDFRVHEMWRKIAGKSRITDLEPAERHDLFPGPHTNR